MHECHTGCENTEEHEDAAGVLIGWDEKPIHGVGEPGSAGAKVVSATTARHKRLSFWDLALLPKFHEVPFTTEGLDTIWSPLVLLEVGQKSVSIEATTTNFDSLLTLFNFWVSTTCDDGPPARTLKRQKAIVRLHGVRLAAGSFMSTVKILLNAARRNQVPGSVWQSWLRLVGCQQACVPQESSVAG